MKAVAQRVKDEPITDSTVAERQIRNLALLDEANELFDKTLAVSSCLTYARKEIDDDGQTIDGCTWIISDNLRRLKQIMHELGAIA